MENIKNMDKRLTVPKWLLINWPKIPQLHQKLSVQMVSPSPKDWDKWVPMHTVAIWTFPFHQNSVKKSDDFEDLTLAHSNLKKSYF